MATSENLIEVTLTDEMETSFLDYALSVIVSRALPDVRDGLKPVQRRILYAMAEAGISSSRPHKKCARIVGDVMGKYHPHGDAAIFDALARMAQPFSLRVPLIDGQGNFGSLDDRPAAMRYVEARLGRAADDIVGLLGENTVDTSPSYDGAGTEPVVLPARIPNLLINGAAGIAVGVATSIPPHHPVETIEAVIDAIAHPKAKDAQLISHIKGPDFPGGGIVSTEGLDAIYTTGKGGIDVRGVAKAVTSGKRRQIIITELPPSTTPSRFITKVAEAVNLKKIEGIRDIADHTDRRTGLQIVIDLRNGASADAVLAGLYHHTPLSDRYNVNMVALVDGVPKLLGLAAIIRHIATFQLEIVRRRSEHRLDVAERRLHLVEGLRTALDDIDRVVATIRKSRTPDTARANLRKLLHIDDTQANHILSMPLRRLTGLEVRNLKDEAAALHKDIAGLKRILGSKKVLAKTVVEELEAIKATYNQPRRTKIVTSFAHTELPESYDIAELPCVVTLSTTGRIGIDSGGRHKHGVHDLLTVHAAARTTGVVYGVDSSGALHMIDTHRLEQTNGRGRGSDVNTVFGVPKARPIVGVTTATVLADEDLVLVTAAGKIKRTSLAHFGKTSGMEIIKLGDGDRVVAAFTAKAEHPVFIITSDGKALRFNLSVVRAQQRVSGGVQGIKLAAGASVIGAGPVKGPDGYIWVITDQGRVKASHVSSYPTKGRATGGVRTIRYLKDETCLVAGGVIGGTVDEFAFQMSDGEPGDARETIGKRDGSGVRINSENGGRATGAGLIR